MSLDLPLIVPAIRLDTCADAAAEIQTALDRAAQPWLAGFILFGGEASQVREMTAGLRRAAGRPIFIASDMERGAGQQVEGLRRLPPYGLVGLAGTPEEAAALGAATAADARSVGIDVLFAPSVDVRSVMDNPILGNRSFGYDPHRVALLGAAVCDGILHAGALPVAKHFPGHGATSTDSHDGVPVVRADRSELEQRDLVPFAHLLAGVVPGLMTAHVAFPALDDTGTIATFSEPIVAHARALAGEHADDLLIFTDALLMTGALQDGGEAEAAARALRAGCDVCLYPTDPEAVAAHLADAPADLRASMETSAQRVRTFSDGAAWLAEHVEPLGEGVGDHAAYEIAQRAVRMTVRHQDSGAPDAVIVIDDDGIEDRGQGLRARADKAAVPYAYVRPAADGALPEDLMAAWALPEPAVDDHVVLVAMASARAWKHSASMSAPGQAVVEALAAWLRARGASHATVWLTPCPPAAGGIHLPGTGPHLEAALSDLFFPWADEADLPAGSDEEA